MARATVISGPVLVVAPHPDDEVLGPGGTIAKLAAAGHDVDVVVVTRTEPPLFPSEALETARREATAAHRVLGIRSSRFLSLPAAGLDTVPHAQVNSDLLEVFLEVRPATLLVPFVGDLHLDHQRAFLSALVCARPSGGAAPRAIYAYETLSETNWNAPYLAPGFTPNVFVDIADHLDTKLRAMAEYGSQLRPFPHERSLEALRALATLRGSTVGCPAAEGFVLVRETW